MPVNISRMGQIALGLALLSGCGTKQIKMTQADRKLLKNEVSFSTFYHKSDLGILMPADFTLGLLGQIAGVNTDPKAKVQSQIKVDPAKAVMDKFLGGIHGSRSTASISYHPQRRFLPNDEIKTIAIEAKDNSIWEFKTTRWLLSYRSFSWATFYLRLFRVRARLISKKDQTIRWQGECSYPGNGKQMEKSKQEVFEGQGFLEMMNAAVEECVGELREQFKAVTS